MKRIEFSGVSKAYGAVKALDNLDLTVNSGITGLLGPNGAGKTTLMKIAATVLAPDGGHLELLGLDPARHDQRAELRRRLGYMPQEPGFYQNFTVFDFVDYVAILKQMTDRGLRHHEVTRVIEIVELGSQARQKVRALSGGMRRRLALAQALLGAPDLVVLDEPTAGLDPEQRLRFRELVSQLPNRPIVLLSTHQTEDIGALCERVIVLSDGRVRFDGTPTQMTATADGRAWTAFEQNPSAELSWRMGDGRFRHVGDPPPDAVLDGATIDDAYLLLAGRHAHEMSA